MFSDFNKGKNFLLHKMVGEQGGRGRGWRPLPPFLYGPVNHVFIFLVAKGSINLRQHQIQSLYLRIRRFLIYEFYFLFSSCFIFVIKFFFRFFYYSSKKTTLSCVLIFYYMIYMVFCIIWSKLFVSPVILLSWSEKLIISFLTKKTLHHMLVSFLYQKAVCLLDYFFLFFKTLLSRQT